ncbi:glycoside hydrolase [Paenibacillus sp. FSL R7-0273]|uniref:beta-glucosidase n=1 Tax=Paenibacillus sp. FSL R7-0273 TaxID=1536772 RepID=UPI0004F6AF53|nr:glycoside hydrolase family 3 C-terminal domain-containing protein [Paenibacillus sp. FSL R7-0273]AIQ48635.1 glycoside hydrolase [Paenibacillus sp. FSL R7-0273]OMF94021.1 glycoside hydrolase [Paenibacillus sp. FSL R7-0273]
MKVSLKVHAVIAAAALSISILAPLQMAGAYTSRPWMDASRSPEDRTELLLQQMTEKEKVDFVTGNVNNYYGFYNNSLERLGIPALTMADGPTGVRIANPEIQNKKSTAFPAPIALAATWDTKAAALYGDLVGEEAFNTTHNVLLGPGLDIARLPWGSRNFESLGEDPLLQSKLGVAYVNAVQSHPVMATAKHYLLNNQETDRFTVDSVASERAIMEIYAKPFAAAIKDAGLASVMCSFNKINGTPACESEYALTDILRDKLNFDGFVMSDYGANLSTAKSALAGLDLETPGEPYGKWGNQLLTAVQNGEVSEEQLDLMAGRTLTQMFDKGLFDSKPVNVQIPAEEHGKAALDIAEDSLVLLQNKNKALPLNEDKLKSIAVIGPDADTYATVGGSSLVTPTYTVTPLDAIRDRAGSGVKVSYAPGTDPVSTGDIVNGPSAIPSSVLTPAGDGEGTGLSGEYWPNNKMEGEPTLTRTDGQVNLNLGFYNFDGLNGQSSKLPQTPGNLNSMMSARWNGYLTAPMTGEYNLSLTSVGTGKLYLDGKLLIDSDGTTLKTEKAAVTLTKGERHEIKIEYKTYYKEGASTDFGGTVRLGWEPPAGAVDSKMQEAVNLAQKSDVAVVVVRTYESEGYYDRSDLDLPNNQDRLISEVAAANPNTVVVSMSGRAVEMDGWQNKVKSIVQAWFTGQEQGDAIARVLFGDVNPSGKLPVTFPVNEDSTPVSAVAQFPGVNGKGEYSEGVMVGYRGYENSGIKPAFAFGHGLSYTTFDYRNVHANVSGKGANRKMTVSLNLRNTGKVTGSEVVQVYVGQLPGKVETAPKQLAGWAKVELKPGKQQRVQIELDPSVLSYWDEKADKWVMPSGKVPVYVGSASDDIRLKTSLTVK